MSPLWMRRSSVLSSRSCATRSSLRTRASASLAPSATSPRSLMQRPISAMTWLHGSMLTTRSARSREGMLQPRQRILHRARPQQRVADLQQVLRQQHGATLGALQLGAHIAHAAKADVGLLIQQPVRLDGLGQPLLHGLQVVAGQHRQGQIHPTAKRAVIGDAGQDLIVFKYLQRTWIHAYLTPILSIRRVIITHA